MRISNFIFKIKRFEKRIKIIIDKLIRHSANVDNLFKGNQIIFSIIKL